MNKLYLIGITGNIGSGKSTVLKLLRKKNYNVLSADEQTQFAYELAKESLRENFSDIIFNEEGEIDRKKLGGIVFSDGKKLEKLNEILHPIIIELLFSKANKLNGIVFLEIPLLFECNLQSKVDEVWVIYADSETKIERIMSRNNVSGKEAQKRLGAQKSIELNALQSHIIIDNSGDFNSLENALNAELKKLEERVEK